CAAENLFDFVPAEGSVCRQDKCCNTRRTRTRTRGTAKIISIIAIRSSKLLAARIIAKSPLPIDCPDTSRQRFWVIERWVSKITAGESTPDGVAEIAIDTPLASVVAGSNGDHLLIA